MIETGCGMSSTNQRRVREAGLSLERSTSISTTAPAEAVVTVAMWVLVEERTQPAGGCVRNKHEEYVRITMEKGGSEIQMIEE